MTSQLVQVQVFRGHGLERGDMLWWNRLKAAMHGGT